MMHVMSKNSHKTHWMNDWKAAGALVSLKGMTRYSNNPSLVWKVVFHSLPGAIWSRLKADLRSSLLKTQQPHCRQENGPICELPTETELMARACH